MIEYREKLKNTHKVNNLDEKKHKLRYQHINVKHTNAIYKSKQIFGQGG